MAKKVVDTTESALEILRRARLQGLPARLGPENPELSICVALVESGHLDGWVTIKGSRVCAVLDARITPSGVEFLEQFEGILKSSPWQTLRPGWLLAGMALFLSVLIFLVSACQGGNTKAVELSSETTPSSDDVSAPRIFGVCGLPPVE